METAQTELRCGRLAGLASHPHCSRSASDGVQSAAAEAGPPNNEVRSVPAAPLCSGAS